MDLDEEIPPIFDEEEREQLRQDLKKRMQEKLEQKRAEQEARQRAQVQTEFEHAKRKLLDGKYLEHDDEWKKLFSWLRENITVDNFVSKEMEEAVKSQEFSEEEINGIDADFPGIFEVKEADVKRAEGQLEALRRAEQEYLEQSDQLGKILQSTNDNVRELSKKALEAECEQETLVETVRDLESHLCLLNARKTDAICDLKEIYKNPKDVMACGHIAMDPIKMQMGIAGKRMEVCMMTFNTEGSAKEAKRLTGEIESFARSSLEIYESLLGAQADVAGMEKMISCMDFTELEVRPQEIDSKKYEMEQLASISEAKIEILTEQCILGKKNEITRTCDEIYKKIYEIKKARAQDRLMRVREIGETSKKFMDIAELLWILMQIDGSKITKFRSVVAGGEDQPPIANFLWNLSENDFQLKESFLVNGNKRISVEYVLDPKRNDKLMEKLAEFGKIEKFLKSLIRGSISTPIVISPEITEMLYIQKCLNDQNESRIKRIKDRFTKEYQEPMASNKLWGYRRMLWIWFLTNPNKILAAIQCASAMVSKKSKTLPGIRNNH
ncbi:hypothetical protein DMENIID0001_099310 [Sergentomyia squamirostris]